MARRRAAFDKLFEKVGLRESPRTYPAKAALFKQGDRCDSIFYILKGKVQVWVMSVQGREAVVAVLNPGAFFGEESLDGQRFRPATATTVTNATIIRIEKSAMTTALQKSPTFSDQFIHHLLTRNIRIQEDLVAQVFNSSEKRLARILLRLAQVGKDGRSELVLPHVSQETLSKMVGTTRARINHFMSKFRTLGFVEYDKTNGLRVHSSLINVIVQP